MAAVYRKKAENIPYEKTTAMKNTIYFITGILLLSLVSLGNKKGINAGEAIARAGFAPASISMDLLERQATWEWIAGGMKRVWWYAEYENGMVVFSHPENYRTRLEVITYYLGGGGNWQACCFDKSGQKKELCYQHVACAALYVYLWGPIIDLGYRDTEGSWVSMREMDMLNVENM